MSHQLDTTKILFQKGQSKAQDVYFIPGYMRIKVKNFVSIDMDSLSAQTNLALIFSIYYGHIPKKIVKKLQQRIILLFNRDDPIQLTQQLQNTVKNNQDKNQIQFTVRKTFVQRVQADVFWSPFQIIHLIFTVGVQPVTTKWGTVKINLLNHQNRIVKLSYSEQGTFGNYDLAQKKMAAQYTNNQFCDAKRHYMKPEQQRIEYEKYIEQRHKQQLFNEVQHFQYAHFNIPVYKFPFVPLITIFFPLWLIAVINLGIFFQDSFLADRINSIAGLMIAFVALIPTIRDQLPPTPQLTFIEILVYIESFTSMLALIHSLDIRGVKNYNLIWYNDGLFLVSFILTIITMLIITGLTVLYYCKWLPSYQKSIQDDQGAQKVKFDRKQWKNQICDYYFNLMNKQQNHIHQFSQDNRNHNKSNKQNN